MLQQIKFLAIVISPPAAVLRVPKATVRRWRQARAKLLSDRKGALPNAECFTLVTKRAKAAAASRRARRRKKLLALGYERAELFLPPSVRAAWTARERTSDPEAPLPLESFSSDLVDILAEWARRWLRAAVKK